MSSSTTQQNEYKAEWQRLAAFQNLEIYPDEDATKRDQSTLACGLIRGYELLESEEVLTQTTKTHPHNKSLHNKIPAITEQLDLAIKLPDITSFAVAAQ